MDLNTYVTFAIALLAVVALIYLVAWVMGRIGVVHRMAGRPGKERRLRVKESLALDAKRHAVILDCDGIEHLVLLGANSELSLGELSGKAGNNDKAGTIKDGGLPQRQRAETA